MTVWIAKFSEFKRIYWTLGLGLYVAKQLVQAHGGHIRSESFKVTPQAGMDDFPP